MARAQLVLPLREAADLLGVHYQTAYGWVRQGLLPATKAGRRYQVNVADVDALGARRAAGTPPRPEVRVRNWQPQADRFYDAIVAGEERLAQTRLERLAAGVPFIEFCERVVAPALRRVGDDWAAGDVTIAVEHRASAICERLIAPLAARQPRGRPRGVAVTATPPGERHGLPALMAAGSLREDHWLVQHLGTDLPANEVGRLSPRRRRSPGSAVGHNSGSGTTGRGGGSSARRGLPWPAGAGRSPWRKPVRPARNHPDACCRPRRRQLRTTGGRVDFVVAAFSGGTVDFGKVLDWSHPPRFSWDGTSSVGVTLPPGRT